MTGDVPRLPAADALLRRRAGTVLAIGDDHGAEVRLPGRPPLAGGPHTLRILDRFRHPTTLADALEDLASPAAGLHEWMELTAAVTDLLREGVIVPVAADAPTGGGGGFGLPWTHISMLDDEVRTRAFIDAVRRTVQPGDVVVEVGTGTGILAVAAAQAGARRVFAIEAGGAAAWARDTVLRNGVADRVEVIQGWSTEVDLPERGNVFVGELIDNDPLTESIVEIVGDARRRLLHPGARLVPQRISAVCVPVGLPEEVRRRHRFEQASAAAWTAAYGIDLHGLADLAPPPMAFTAAPGEVAAWTWLTDPVTCVSLDLADVGGVGAGASAAGVVLAGGRVDAVATYFHAEVGPQVTLSTDPRGAAYPTSWRVPVWVLPTPVEVAAGDVLRVTYAYRRGGAERVTVVRDDGPCDT